MPPASKPSTTELRLTRQERANVLRVLEGRRTAAPRDSRRASERAEYEPAAPPLVELQSPATDGGTGFVVVARNLSSGGIAFLHGAEVPPGSRCTVTLFDARATPQAIPAQVIRCSRVAGRIHDIGVKFDQPVDAQRFLARPAAPPADAPEAAKPAQAVERLCDAVLKLRELESSGWPGDRLRAALHDLADLCNTALKTVDDNKQA